MKRAGRLVFLAGAVALGLFLFRASPRDVTLVYAVADAHARALEVDVEKGGAAVRHAEFRLGEGAPRQVRHEVRLTDGDYVLRITVRGDGPPVLVVRPVTITESGTVVIPVGG